MSAPWQIESNTGKSLVLAAGSLLAGALFIWLTCRIPTQDSNTAAAMWLGVLLAGVGLAAIIWAEDVVTVVDPNERALNFKFRRRTGTVSETVSFDDVASVNVARVGSRSDGTPSFWLQVVRLDGKRFSTGRWSTDVAEIRRLAERLADEIGCECGGSIPPAAASAGRVVAAALCAVVLYAVWFRFNAGPWCPAMWFGFGPPFFVLTVFSILLCLLRRFWV